MAVRRIGFQIGSRGMTAVVLEALGRDEIVAALARAAATAGEGLERTLVAEMAEAMLEGGGLLPALCGEVYERRLARDRDGRRAGGAYYTPATLVELVVEATVGRALEGRELEGALGLRVVDPACGGGVFLLAAIERIAAHCARVGGGPAGRYRREIAERCVRGVDIDPTAAQVCRLAIALATGGRAAIATGDALLGEGLLEAGGFDVVLGNPPWGQKGFRFDAATAARLRGRYLTARGVLDPFKLFVERGLELVRQGGRWGMVLPDIVLLKDQQALRRLLLERSAIELIADAGRAFAGVNLDAVVIAGRVEAPAPGHRVAVWTRVPDSWRAEPPTTTLPQALFVRLPGQRFNIHLDEAAVAALDRLAALPRLGEVFEVHEGVHSGNARARLFRRDRPRHGAPLVLGGGELGRYRLRWGGRWLDLDPVAIDRPGGGYANLGRPAWHRAGKLVVRRTGDRILAARDRDGVHVSNNAFVVLPRAPMAEAELLAYLALLNSGFMTWYFRTVQPRTGRLFAELKIQHLVDFPRPAAAAWEQAMPELARLAAEAERLAASDDAAAALAAIDASIDATVAAAFGLEPPAPESPGASLLPPRTRRPSGPGVVPRC